VIRKANLAAAVDAPIASLASLLRSRRRATEQHLGRTKHMSFLNRLFKKDTPLPSDPSPPEPLYLGDYAELAPTPNPPPPGGTFGMLHFDFRHVFPHVSWASDTIVRPENPSGFSLKVLTARHEPSGEVECAFFQQMFDGGKLVIRHFKVAREDFDAIEELVRNLEARYSTRFDCRDFRRARTSEDFKKMVTGGQPPPLPPSVPPPLPGASS